MPPGPAGQLSNGQVPKMSLWKTVRVAITGLAFLSGLFAPASPPAKPPMTWPGVGLIAAVFPVAMLFGFGVLSILRGRRLQWQPPSWDRNPFTLAHPEQFFHFSAFVTLMSGAAMLARAAYTTGNVTPDSCVPIALGIGVLVGLRLMTIAYLRKTRHRA